MVGVALGGGMLAVLVPVLSHSGLLDPGGTAGAIVVTGVLMTSVGLMVLRPGSALNRRFER
jgi:hypothetical protein